MRRSFAAIAALALLAIVAAAGFWFYTHRAPRQPTTAKMPTDTGAPLKTVPLTTDPALERNPAISPDGRHIAYVSARQGNWELYVQLIGAGGPLRLTTTPEAEMSPAWSPDGSFIAFVRGRGERKAVYKIPALGGVEKKLTDSSYSTPRGITAQRLDWSPDGKTLAIFDKPSEDEPWAIFLLFFDTGEIRRLTTPPSGSNGDILVAFSPDGSRLAFARTRGFRGDLYVVPMNGGEPTRITSEDTIVFAVRWANDGSSLLFTASRAQSDVSLWRVSARRTL